MANDYGVWAKVRQWVAAENYTLRSLTQKLDEHYGWTDGRGERIVAELRQRKKIHINNNNHVRWTL